MIVSEIATRVTRQFGDAASIQVDNTDIIRWVNDAQNELALANQLLQTSAATATVVGQQEYIIPPDILTIRSVRYKNSKLRALNYNEAEEYIIGLDNAVLGTPKEFWVWANKISLYPLPDTALATGLTIFYTRQPQPVALITDLPELPLQYHNAIVQYCLQQAYELDENWSAATAKQQQFDTATKQLKDNTDWLERDFYPMVTSTDTAEYMGYNYGW